MKHDEKKSVIKGRVCASYWTRISRSWIKKIKIDSMENMVINEVHFLINISIKKESSVFEVILKFHTTMNTIPSRTWLRDFLEFFHSSNLILCFSVNVIFEIWRWLRAELKQWKLHLQILNTARYHRLWRILESLFLSLKLQQKQCCGKILMRRR